jgi:hypothetical protein
MTRQKKDGITEIDKRSKESSKQKKSKKME